MGTIKHLYDLAKTIKSKRLELGLTQTELAQKAGVSRRWLIGLEQGDLQDARLTTILKTLEALEISLKTTGTQTIEVPVPRISAQEILRATAPKVSFKDLDTTKISASALEAIQKLQHENLAKIRLAVALGESRPSGKPQVKEPTAEGEQL